MSHDHYSGHQALVIIPGDPCHHALQNLDLGLRYYRDRHHLPWQVHVLPRSDTWRCNVIGHQHAGPVVLAGLINASCLQEWRQRPFCASSLCISAAACHDDQTWLVQVDDECIAHQAVAHLHQAGYRHLLIWGKTSESRRRAINAHALHYGMSVAQVSTDRSAPSAQDGEQTIRNTIADLGFLVGILAHQDAVGLFISRFCATHALQVPNDIGIIGVDNAPAICEACNPPLSSVRVPWRMIGERMGNTIHRLLAGAHDVPRVQVIPSFGVYMRRSTDRKASIVSDPVVREFQRRIRMRQHGRKGIAAIAADLNISRATLHQRVRRHTNRSPQDLLHDQRIAVACRLLTESCDDLDLIAKSCGYGNRQLLHRAFVARMGVSPGVWRKGCDSPR